MTKLDLVIARVRQLPLERQEAVAVQLDHLVDDEVDGAELLAAEQWAEIERRMAGPDDFAADDEVEAFFKRHGA
jgi:hypothetical protein